MLGLNRFQQYVSFMRKRELDIRGRKLFGVMSENLILYYTFIINHFILLERHLMIKITIKLASNQQRRIMEKKRLFVFLHISETTA